MPATGAPSPTPPGEFESWELELIGHLVRDFLEIYPHYASIVLARWEAFSGGTAERLT